MRTESRNTSRDYELTCCSKNNDIILATVFLERHAKSRRAFVPMVARGKSAENGQQNDYQMDWNMKCENVGKLSL
jgi:hypothetical protein